MKADKPSFLFQYRPNRTVVHRLSAGIKLCILCLCSCIFHSSSQAVLAGCAVFLFIAAICARLSAGTIKKNGIFLSFYTLLIFLVKAAGSTAVLWDTAAETFFFMQKIALILFAASVFYETTSKLELFIFFEKAERLIRRNRATGSPALLFTLMLICVPRVFELWAQLNYAYDARTDTRRNIISGYRRAVFLLPALIENLIRFAAIAEKAIKNRTAVYPCY